MSNERYLIINADDFGMCHSTNQAISKLLLEKVISSASIMVTTPWIQEAAEIVRKHPNFDVGIHITHTSEWNDYKWGGLTHLKTLVNEFGHFPPDTQSVVEKADYEELRTEAIAQIELAYKMGIEPTNIDNHMGSLHHIPELLLELCERYNLPLRYPKQLPPELARLGDPTQHEEIINQAERKGILLPDFIKMLPFFPSDYPEDGQASRYELVKKAAENLIRGLEPGITELVSHPSLATYELKAITDTWEIRQYEFDLFRDEEFKKLLDEEGIKLMHWRDLRDQQRK